MRSDGGENHANQGFFHVSPVPELFPFNVVGLRRTLPNEEGYFQDRLNYLFIGNLFEVGKKLSNEIVQNATERQPRAEFLMSGITSQKQTKR